VCQNLASNILNTNYFLMDLSDYCSNQEKKSMNISCPLKSLNLYLNYFGTQLGQQFFNRTSPNSSRLSCIFTDKCIKISGNLGAFGPIG
jgi:hypothetical protein